MMQIFTTRLYRFQGVAFFLAALILLGATSAKAVEPAPERDGPPDDRGIFTFSYENDIVSGEDNNYTNGIRIAYLSPEENIPGWLERGAAMLPFFPHDSYKRWH